MRKKGALTLIELIVVITILAILGTLAFISTKDMASKARNSSRITDIGSIKNTLQIYFTEQNLYPKPDTPVTVSYSGSHLWTQGTLGKTVHENIKRLSDIPLDPLYKIPYTYSVLADKSKYQIGALLEGSLLIQNPSIITKTYAELGNKLSYTNGNYVFNDVIGKTTNNCYILSSPSIILNTSSNLILNLNNNYNFVFQDSKNISPIFGPYIYPIDEGDLFQVTKVYEGCHIDNIGSLSYYLSNLSDTYQQFSHLSKYEQLVYDLQYRSYMFDVISQLRERGITVSPQVDLSVRNNNFFNDNFNAANISLVSGHNSIDGSWKNIGSISDLGDYYIDNNTLRKGISNNTIIIPDPYIPLNSNNTTTSFVVKDFASGPIKVYTRYTDNDNYYELELLSTGYKITSNVAGVTTILQNISEVIPLESAISFSIIFGNIKLNIDNIQKENIVDNSNLTTGVSGINLQSLGAQIDNYSLIYN